MDLGKDALLSHSSPVESISVHPRVYRRRHGVRRPRGFKFFALACLGLIAFAQWKQMRSGRVQQLLSLQQLEQDLATCKKLQHKPQDPLGLGRDKNARYVAGHKPTLIQNATIWVGDAAEGTPVEDVRSGKGYSWITADVLLEYGLIKKIEPYISLQTLPRDCEIWDAKGRQLTSGIIDMHSHAGVYSLPVLKGNEDDNELSSDTTPYVRSIDGINPLDHQIQVIKSGGVTTSLVLPGSGNNIGGEAYVVKHAVGKQDGRSEISVEDMLADPDRNWRYMKMACGENAKRIYGKIARGPFSRLGESWYFRHAFEQAAKLNRAQDDWCHAAASVGVQHMDTYLPQELKWEALGAALRGQVHINTHCYTVPDLEAFVDHTNEFRFPVRAFHHAHQTFLVPEILKRAWGGRPPASALFADNMYYKAEAYVGSEYAGKILWEHGLTPVYVSDNPVLNAQHVLFEAAKAYRYGLPYHVALASVTTAPADLLGLGQRIGKIKPGFDADIVVWDSDPLSVGATPVQVWIDGTAQFNDPFELKKQVEKPVVTSEDADSVVEEPREMQQVVFKGVSKVLLPGWVSSVDLNEGPFNVAVLDGSIVCVGTCDAQLRSSIASGDRIVELKNGYLTKSFTALGSTIGLNTIDAEDATDNGSGLDVFSRAIDGLALDDKKSAVAYRYGVTRAISAPKFRGGMTHQGTTVGFLTGATHALEDGAVWKDDVAVHYTLTPDAKSGPGTPSISSAVGALRHKLLDLVAINDTTCDPYTEKAYLQKVLTGQMPLVLTVHSADAIAALLRVKSDVERALPENRAGTGSATVRMVILGGAESHLLAKELAEANVGVVLSPFQAYSLSWDQRRSLYGAPLTNGTNVDHLLDAGVTTAIGLEGDWVVRDLSLLAGVAYKNGGGRLSEQAALDLISSNIYTMLNVGEPSEADHFVLFEGSPFEIGSRIKAVGGGRGSTAVFV